MPYAMREEQIRAMGSKLIMLLGDHELTTAEVMDSGMLERQSPSLLDAKLFN
jgi:high-affinity K+ transport system ATPase subunit B